MKKSNKITVAEIDNMIIQEMTRLKKIEKIKSQLAIVNEDLKRLSEEEGLDEVEVGGVRNGEEWYEKGTPVAKFEKKGTHLKEEDPIADDMGDSVDDTIELDSEDGIDGAPETFEEKMAAIGRELDMKLGGAGMDMAAEPVADEISLDEPEVSDTPEMSDAPEDDSKEDSEEDSADEDGDEDKDDEIEIDEVINYESKEETPALNEGKTVRKNPILSKELERMQRLSGI